MFDILSRLLTAIFMSLPFLVAGGANMLFAKQLQESHVKHYAALYKRLPFLKWFDPFYAMRQQSSMGFWNKVGGFAGFGMGIVTFVVVLFNV